MLQRRLSSQCHNQVKKWTRSPNLQLFKRWSNLLKGRKLNQQRNRNQLQQLRKLNNLSKSKARLTSIHNRECRKHHSTTKATCHNPVRFATNLQRCITTNTHLSSAACPCLPPCTNGMPTNTTAFNRMAFKTKEDAMLLHVKCTAMKVLTPSLKGLKNSMAFNPVEVLRSAPSSLTSQSTRNKLTGCPKTQLKM